MADERAKTTTIEVGALARVEGEGALHVRVRAGKVEDVRLEIFEPPRFFEALLRGRRFAEAPDITSRICGICPIAYQMSACAAIEDALGIEVSEPVRLLRRLIYCGEWLESHALHVFMLHAPDFLGYPGAIEMANDGHGEVVERGLRIKQAGNQLIAAIGGRSVHPVNARVGGFYRAPTGAELAPVAERLKHARELLIATVAWAGTLDFPERTLGAELASLRQDDHGGDYPIEGGRLVSTEGLDIGPREFPEHVVEEHVAHSTALHGRLLERGNYVLGPLARYALNRDRLAPVAVEAADAAGLEPVCRNPFRSIVVRSVEMLHAADEALRLIAAYEPPDPPFVEAEPAAAVGLRLDRGPARHAVAPLRARRGGTDRQSHDRPAHLSKPAFDRGRPARVRTGEPRAARQGSAMALRAGGAQLRPVHLLRDAFHPARVRPRVSARAPLVIGLGNAFRSDDAVGLEVARRVRRRAPALRVIELEREPSELIAAWEDADPAIVVDAVSGPEPGRIHRVDAPGDGAIELLTAPASSHALGLGEVIELARSLRRLPRNLFVFGVEGSCFDYGEQLSAPVAARVEAVAAAVVAAAGR